MHYIKLYLLTIPVFFAIDILWLGFIAKRFYREKLAAFLNPDVNWIAAGIFYLIFIIGIIFFAVVPAKAKDSLSVAAVYGALVWLFYICHI